MTETVEIGSTPSAEDCAQVGAENYDVHSRAECYAYLDQLYRFLRSKGYNTNELPGNFRLVVKSNAHDFGSYREVVAKFDEDSEEACNIAYMLESEGPEHWDDEAKAIVSKFFVEKKD